MKKEDQPQTRTDFLAERLARPKESSPESQRHRDINDLTCQINGAVFEVNKELGGGFLEKLYENAMLAELQARGLKSFPSAKSAEGKVSGRPW